MVNKLYDMSWGEFRFTETIFAIEMTVKSVQINLNLYLYELVIMISSSI